MTKAPHISSVSEKNISQLNKNVNRKNDSDSYSLTAEKTANEAIDKSTVEEQYTNYKNPHDKRFHNLKHIKKIAEITGGRTSDSNRSGGSTNSDSTIK